LEAVGDSGEACSELCCCTRGSERYRVYPCRRSRSAVAQGLRAAAVKEGCGMIEVILNDRLGKKVRVKCNEDDTIGDLKKLVAAQVGTRPEKIKIQKWYTVYKDHITLEDYEIHDGMGLELYYN